MKTNDCHAQHIEASPEVQRHPLRIAVVTETWPPEVNGVAMSIARVVHGLQRRRHSIQLVRPRQDDEAQARSGIAGLSELLTPGMPVPGYPSLKLGRPCRRLLQERWSTVRPDVVHIATEGPLGWSGLQAARRLGIPVSSDFRTNFDAYSEHYGLGWLHGLIRAYLRRFHNQSGLTTVPTESLRAELAHAGFERMTVIARGVDNERFCPSRRSESLRQTWGADSDDLVVTCIGRLAAEKNLHAVMDAFGSIKLQHPRARLVLVGDGPLRQPLESRHPDTVFAGQQTGDALAAHYASADLFLFPSLTETFGNVTTEAMASGLPVVAFARAAAAELIHDGINGRVLPTHDKAGFIAAALELAGDAQQRRCIGEAARRSVSRLGWPAIIAQFEDRLRELVALTHQPH